VSDKPDFESTTAILKRRAPGLAWIPKVVRDNLSPTALWSAIGALVIAIGYVLNAQHSINALKDSVEESKKSVTELQAQLNLLHKIDTQIAVMSNKVDTIAAEVDRQREWRERIEDLAERTPPHARLKPRN
jgi:hypothetical protein